jgi:hypothetical protein
VQHNSNNSSSYFTRNGIRRRTFRNAWQETGVFILAASGFGTLFKRFES